MVKEQPQDQQGSALIVSLVFLLLLTLVSVAGIKSSTGQERMAANVKLKIDSFQAAESALRLIQHQLALATSNNKPLPKPCTGASCNTNDAVFDLDSTGTPGAGWVQIPRSAAINNMEVWYRITSLGETLAPANTVSANTAYEGPGNLYRIVVVSFLGSTRTVLESVYVHYAV
ncbi:MAG: type IV pilus assembly protein PilX [Halopseudomonas sp.]|jgi:type IV pilus assembly protein PilX|uniref:pilus assembly PilX family protein n=1 Tax=Halopseudomonas sp. TaxID=2901191 RepID=UPI0039E29985